MYRVATFLVNQWWGKPADMADAIGVLMLTWNQAFYRYGRFEFSKLESFLKKNISVLTQFRKRNIRTLALDDEKEIIRLFDELLDALKIQSENHKVDGRKSPVAVAKALHLLAPNFFPLWDDKIARAYSIYYRSEPARKYVEFCRINKELERQLGSCVRDSEQFLKLMDEFNYAKYTFGWV